MSWLELQEVAKRYRVRPNGPMSVHSLLLQGWTRRTERWALKNISLSVARGEVLGVVGANGSGKSTLLRLVAGVSRPTLGRVFLAGKASGLLTIGEGFDPLLTAEENVITGGVLAGLTRREAQQRLPQVAAFAELESHMDQPLRTYSDGMRLRLAFATSVSTDPELLLIDEILSVGDVAFQEKCFERLEQLSHAGVTLLVASHDLPAVRRLCGRVLWLAGGRTQGLGDADRVVDLYEEAAHATGFGDSGEPGHLRPGSREIEIVAVRLRDRKGGITQEVAAGDPLTIEFDFFVHTSVTEAIFSVGIHHVAKGIHCLDVNTSDDEHHMALLSSTGTATLDLERVDLADGEYQVDVGVYEKTWMHTYDYVWEAARLVVTGSGTMSGVVSPPRKWSMPASGDSSATVPP